MTVLNVLMEMHSIYGYVKTVTVKYSNGNVFKRIYDYKVSDRVPVAVEKI